MKLEERPLELLVVSFSWPGFTNFWKFTENLYKDLYDLCDLLECLEIYNFGNGKLQQIFNRNVTNRKLTFENNYTELRSYVTKLSISMWFTIERSSDRNFLRVFLVTRVVNLSFNHSNIGGGTYLLQNDSKKLLPSTFIQHRKSNPS